LEKQNAKAEAGAKAFKQMRKREWEAIEIQEAWTDLRPQSFAMWIRFHVFTAQQLKGGRSMWARAVKVSEFTMYSWLKELVDKGYIRLVKNANAQRTGLVLLKRARVRFGNRHTWFVKI
jgi:hypothetical protein